MKRKPSADKKPVKRQTTLDAFLNIKQYVKWEKPFYSVLFGTVGEFKLSPKVAAFDFDGTIATVCGTYIYPKNGDDWKWYDDTVPEILCQIAAAGYSLVIITNQVGIEEPSNHKRKQAFVGRIENTAKHLEKYCKSKAIPIPIPPIAIIASADRDIYRKPRIGMWKILQDKFKDIEIDMKESFYCGDAAGRDWLVEKSNRVDHADTDYKFALNVGLQFFVPEQLFHSHLAEKYKSTSDFLHTREHRELPPFGFDPTTVPKGARPEIDLSPFDLVVFVGPPGSGKSSFYRHHQSVFIHVNQDELKTLDKCKKLVQTSLQANLKVIIDNTNPSKPTRKIYLDMAKGKRSACVWFTTEFDHCAHNMYYREFLPALKKLLNNEEVTLDSYGKHIPKIAVNSYWKSFQEPTESEGFEKVFKVPFVFDPNSEENESLYRHYYH